MFQTKVVEEIKEIVFNNFFFKYCAIFLDSVEIYFRASQATDENTAHAHCTLDNKGYTHTHSQFVTLIAFPLQRWVQEPALILRHKYIDCLV